jgi:hypothetical protein
MLVCMQSRRLEFVLLILLLVQSAGSNLQLFAE